VQAGALDPASEGLDPVMVIGEGRDGASGMHEGGGHRR
jgi:hypothetical protein